MRWKLIAALPFAIGLAAWQSVESIHILGAGDAPIVDGRIVQREKIRYWGGIPGGKLTIELAGQDVTVIARTNLDALQTLPDAVRFQYTGVAGREVFLEGEEHPLWVAVFLWAVSAGTIAFCIVPNFRSAQSPNKEATT